MPDVTLHACGPERARMISNLFQLYIHDFSEFWTGEARGAIREDGRFEPYPYLQSYWREPDRSAWLIRSDGEIAGFALLSPHGNSGLPTDHSIAEFFVLRKHRRSGVGQAAALALIGPRAGQWEIAVTRANTKAQVFWRRVAGAAADAVEAHDQDDENWRGLILRFQIG